MNRKTLKTLAITAALAGVMTASAQAASIGGATVEASAVNFRSSAGTDASIYTTVPRGTVLVVGEKVSDSWYKAVYRGAVGYVASEFVKFYETIDGNLGSGSISGTSVRMRSEASTSADILGTYNSGVTMNVLGVSGNWYKVSYNGVTGYVHSDYFSLNSGVSDLYGGGSVPPSDSTVSDGETSEKGQQIVDTAMKYMGVPYVWAGTSPSGFDCSGFVYYVYKENGYSINRTAASIYLNGTAVEKENLQVGDAVCFSSSSESIGHVGIYIGGGQFIHASSGVGQVIISELSSTYYTTHYVGARRLV